MQQAGETYGFSSFLIFFTKKLRLSNPWNFKAPLLITFPYLLFLLSEYRGPNSFFAIIASIAVIIGVAGLGYLSNDLGDRKKDALIGKENVLIGMQPVTILFLFLLFFAFTFLPWLYLPFNSFSAILLGLEIVLFFVYALPPFRFKERGFLGVCADALYAHVLPALLASFTFYLFTKSEFEDFPFFLILVFLWQFIQGVRNILFHQIKDFDSDLKSGTRTFVILISLSKTVNLIKRLILPLELLVFSLFLIIMSTHWRHFGSSILVIVFFLVTYLSNRKKIGFMDYRAKAYAFLDDCYTQWFPLIVLFELCLSSLSFIPILILHFLIFNNGIKSLLSSKPFYLRVFKK